jgi:tetratricopeptide (TPR) repeat protein
MGGYKCSQLFRHTGSIFTGMKKIIFLLVCSCFAIAASPQQNADSLQQTGRDYMRKGDWGNAIMVFNRALQQKPNDLSLLNDIAYTYFLQRDFVKALETIKPVVESDKADVQSFQIAGTVYRAIEELKEGARIYTRGLKKFPTSGVLYSEYGELLWQKKDYAAITQWEKGISVDPSYPGNYYNASRYYYFTPDKVWSLIYGEIFVNLESYTIRTAEIKNILFDGYKKLFADPDLLKNYDSKKNNAFEKTFLTSMNSQSQLAAAGIDPARLIAIRKGFIKTWFETYAAAFPFRLFDYHKQLLEANMYEAYNQWIFGSAINPEQYQTWIKNNPDAYNTFNNFQRGRVFKLPKGQYYQNK